MTRTRTVGIALCTLGALIGVAPFLHWYRVDIPGRDLPISGIDAAGELWSLPILGAVLIGVGLAIAAAVPDPSYRAGRWLAAAAAASGVFATAWALKGALTVRAVAVPVGVADGPVAPLAAQPLAFLTAALAACVVCVALAWVRSGSGSG